MNRVGRFIGLVMVLFSSMHTIASEDVISWWDLDQAENGEVLDKANRIKDALEGGFTPVAGVRGSAVRFDGYTTCIVRKADDAPKLGKHFTIEAWVAQGAYPWNLCPIVSQSIYQKKGYYFAVGPRGEVTLEAMINGKWLLCTSESFVLPLWKWSHIAAKYDTEKGLAVYVNGKPAKAVDATGQIDYADETELRIGCNHQKMKPSHIHREHGTLPGWFSLDGIVDEIKIHNRALNDEQVLKLFNDSKSSCVPDLPARVLPSGPKGPGRFGACYTKLEYYPEWDNLWAVDSDPDVLVRFDEAAARVVFWRGSRYSPAWVSENGLWMADQSVEAWGVGKADTEGCFEHMQDRRCRYSHVRIIESNPARVVVHWRYAPVSSHDHLWRENPKTTRACWVDEYYYIYPDTIGVRKPTWKTGTLKSPRQFQESLPFTHPGQLVCDVLQKDFAYVGNLKGQMQSMEYVENPKESKKQFPSDLLFQMYNFKAENKPFIVFEPGNKMHYVRDFSIKSYERPGACNHWPVGQALCDGRTVQAADRPTHFMGFPISYPPVHEKDGRSWWNGLYGMFRGPRESLVTIARSYNRPPKLKIKSNGFSSEGFDRAQRAYQITCEHPGKASTLECTIEASAESPLYNLPIVVKNWTEADYQLTVNGKAIQPGKDFRVGYRHLVDSTNAVVWIKLKSSEPVKMKLSSAKKTGPRSNSIEEARSHRFEPVVQKIEGWTVHIDPQLLKGEHSQAGGDALKMLANHLQRIAILLPEEKLARMRKLEIWIEHHHPTLGAMQYHPDIGWLESHGHDLRLAKKVHIPRAKNLLFRHQMIKHPAVVLHELAHAWHDQYLGFDEQRILDAYKKAKAAGIYEKVLLYTGEKVRHYGLTDQMEYFAEGTEAYFYRNDFYPFCRAELKEHDPALHDLLVEIWGPLQ